MVVVSVINYDEHIGERRCGCAVARGSMLWCHYLVNGDPTRIRNTIVPIISGWGAFQSYGEVNQQCKQKGGTLTVLDVTHFWCAS